MRAYVNSQQCGVVNMVMCKYTDRGKNIERGVCVYVSARNTVCKHGGFPYVHNRVQYPIIPLCVFCECPGEW